MRDGLTCLLYAGNFLLLQCSDEKEERGRRVLVPTQIPYNSRIERRTSGTDLFAGVCC